MMKAKKVIRASILAQLLIESVDEIERDHPEIFRHGFKQKGKAFVDELVSMQNKILLPLSQEHQFELIQLTGVVEEELNRLLDQTEE